MLRRCGTLALSHATSVVVEADRAPMQPHCARRARPVHRFDPGQFVHERPAGVRLPRTAAARLPEPRAIPQPAGEEAALNPVSAAAASLWRSGTTQLPVLTVSRK